MFGDPEKVTVRQPSVALLLGNGRKYLGVKVYVRVALLHCDEDSQE